jgi:hypothetical protein
LQNNPEKRYQNVHQLHDDLQNHRYLGKRRIATRLVGRLSRLGVPLLLVLVGVLLIYRGHINLHTPFVSWFSEMTPAVAAGLCLLLGGLYFLLVALGHKNHQVKITKSIHLTGKKYIGLLTLLFSFMVLTAAGQMGVLDSKASHHLALEEQLLLNNISAFIRHHDGHKLLIRHDTVYNPTNNNLLIEIPLAGLPQGKEFIVKVIADDGEASYESREFLIRVGE